MGTHIQILPPQTPALTSGLSEPLPLWGGLTCSTQAVAGSHVSPATTFMKPCGSGKPDRAEKLPRTNTDISSMNYGRVDEDVANIR